MRITDYDIKTKMNKKRKRNKSRKVLRIIFIIAILLIIGFIILKALPVKDVTDENININLSTLKPTGDTIKATISTSTSYDIYYYLDYSEGEAEYYASSYEETEEKLGEFELRDIDNKEYKKMQTNILEIENNGVVYLKYGRFGKLSNIPYVFDITNIDKSGPDIIGVTTESTDSSITVSVEAEDDSGDNLQYYFRLQNQNSFLSNGTKNKYTFTELTTDDTYIIVVKVIDKFGNESEAVAEAIASLNATTEVVEQKLYYFKVNLAQNVVTVYDKDENGEYTKPIKAMLCSTGRSTPKSGKYKTEEKYRWLSLFGGVYGQYAVRITGHILFHSVPYTSMAPNTLEYEEFDKLGTSASLGCIRLTVKDVKWIYDNAKIGSTVEFYSDSSDPGPLGKPTIQKISNDKNRNWDPTDPDTHNPWNGGDGVVVKQKVIPVSPDTNSITNNTNTNTNTTNETNTIEPWNTND